MTETGNINLVVMDDFLYGEPRRAVPEPSALLLLSAGITGWVVLRRRRSR